MRGSSLTKKALIAALILLLPVFVALIHTYRDQKNRVENEALSDMHTVAREIDEGLEPFLERTRVRAADFSTDGMVKRALVNVKAGGAETYVALNAHLRENKLAVDPSIEAVYVVTSGGRVAASSDPKAVGRDVSGERFFKSGLSGVSLSDGASWRSDAVIASAPVYGDGRKKAVGVIANVIPMASVIPVLAYRVRHEAVETPVRVAMESLNGYAVSRSGLVLGPGSESPPRAAAELLEAPPVGNCLAGGAGTAAFYQNHRGVEVAGASVCLHELGWAVVAEMDRDEALREVYPVLRVVLAAGFAASAIIAALMLLFFRNVVAPLRRMAFAAWVIRDGKYNVTVPVATTDEIGSLAESFNEMAAGIRSRAEALEKTTTTLKTAQRIARICSVEWDILKDQTRWSDETASVLKLRPGEEPPDFRTFMTRFVRTDDKPRLDEAVDSSAFGGEPFSVKCRVVRGDGAERTVRVDGASASDESGRPAVMTITVHDVTEHAEAEEAARRNEEKYRNLVEATSDWVWEVDADCRYTYASPKVRDILGYEPWEVIGKTPFDFMPAGEAERVAALFKPIAEERRPFFLLENANLRNGGRLVILETSGVPIFGDDGAFLGYRGIDRDVTESKKLREQMARSEKMETIGLFAGHLSHDCKNIFTVISANAQHLLKKLDERGDDALAASCRHIVDASVKGTALVHELLSLGRGERLDMRKVDMNDVVGELIDGAVIPMLPPTVKAAVHLAPVPLEVAADRAQMEQVILNLCDNAIDAMPGGGLISIATAVVRGEDWNAGAVECGCRLDGSSVLLAVSDTGEGMDETTRARVFEPFFTTKRAGKGAGLGLAKAYAIVKRHGGCIDVASEPGKGTTFRIFLPSARRGCV